MKCDGNSSILIFEIGGIVGPLLKRLNKAKFTIQIYCWEFDPAVINLCLSDGNNNNHHLVTSDEQKDLPYLSIEFFGHAQKDVAKL